MGSQINARGDVLVLGNRYQSFWCRSEAGMRICRAGLRVAQKQRERREKAVKKQRGRMEGRREGRRGDRREGRREGRKDRRRTNMRRERGRKM